MRQIAVGPLNVVAGFVVLPDRCRFMPQRQREHGFSPGEYGDCLVFEDVRAAQRSTQTDGARIAMTPCWVVTPTNGNHLARLAIAIALTLGVPARLQGQSPAKTDTIQGRVVTTVAQQSRAQQ